MSFRSRPTPSGRMRNPPIITSSDTPAHRLTFGTNAVDEQRRRPAATTTSIAGCAHVWKLRSAVRDQTLHGDRHTDDRRRRRTSAVGYLRMARTRCDGAYADERAHCGSERDV